MSSSSLSAQASVTIVRQSRPALQISRIADFISSKSRLLRRTRERLTKRLGEKLMRAQGKLGTDAVTSVAAPAAHQCVVEVIQSYDWLGA
jgi:hypothetical protein